VAGLYLVFAGLVVLIVPEDQRGDAVRSLFEGFGSNPKDDRSALEIYCASYIRMGET